MAQPSSDLEIFRGLVATEGVPIFSLVRGQFVEVNQWGRPTSVDLDTQPFTGAESGKVLETIAGEPDLNHELVLPLPGKRISARLLGEPSVDELVIVQLDGRQGISPRSVDGHHGISADENGVQTINISINPRDDKLLDRGLVWLHVAQPDEPVLSFIVLAGQHSVEELKDGLETIAQKGGRILSDLVSGMDHRYDGLVVTEK